MFIIHLTREWTESLELGGHRHKEILPFSHLYVHQSWVTSALVRWTTLIQSISTDERQFLQPWKCLFAPNSASLYEWRVEKGLFVLYSRHSNKFTLTTSTPTLKANMAANHQPKSSRNLNIHGQTTNQHIHVTLYVISNYTPVQMIQQSKPWQETVLRVDCEITIENWSLLYPTTGIRGKQTQTRRKIMKKLRGKRAGKIMTKKLLQIIRRRDFLFFGGKLYGEKKDKIFYA